MRIDYQVIANGEDITGLLDKRLVSIMLTDQAGISSDTCELSLDDRGWSIELPETDAELEISLGFVETGLTSMGIYLVDEVRGAFMPDTIEITGKAADMIGPMKSPATKAWKEKTLGQIAQEIAGRHSLRSEVAPALRDVFYAYVAQTAESDMHFITRLAHDVDGTAKIAGGTLLIAERGAGKTASGEDFPVVSLTRSQFSSGGFTVGTRGKHKSVSARWEDRADGTVNTATAGSGDPKRELRHKFPTKDEAQRAADAELARGARSSNTFSGVMAGFFPSLTAEGKIDVQGVRPEVAGEYTLTSVTHTLQGTLTTSFEAERAPPE
ncbi:phage late control D family protein [Pseudaestuariivita sp.]|uniref:phage late control D family protein n=1 Tax=Pseudaestuariivita sp. TaxID=2211669 RepID=UPI00405825D5